jgi:hypothetical protein
MVFLKFQNCNYLKIFFKQLKNNFKIISFEIFYICLIASWFEIGNGKKNYFQYHLNIHILNQFSTTLEKEFQKGL